MVFSDGNPKTNIMLIGEAPGANEDTEGLPFVGRAGALLDKMLAAINLNRKKVVFYTNHNTKLWAALAACPRCLPFACLLLAWLRC